jgi:hypothetical protein
MPIMKNYSFDESNIEKEITEEVGETEKKEIGEEKIIIILI